MPLLHPQDWLHHWHPAGPAPAREGPMPEPTPVPAPAPAPPARDALRTGLALIVALFVALVLAAALAIGASVFIYERYIKATVPAAAVNPKIVPAVRAYLKNYPEAIRQVAADLRAGRIKDKDKDGKLDTGDALEAARKKGVDDLGAILDEADPAEWEQVAAAFEGDIKP